MNLCQFLYKEPKFQDEGIHDYLDRLAFWNGYENSSKLIESLVAYYNKIFVGKSNLLRENRAYLAIEHLFKKNIPSHDLNSVNESNFPSSERKICYICWRNEKYLRFYWRIDYYLYCHIHNVELKKFKGDFSFVFDEIGLRADDFKIHYSSVLPDDESAIFHNTVLLCSTEIFALEKIMIEMKINLYIKSLIFKLDDIHHDLFKFRLHTSLALENVKIGTYISKSIDSRMNTMVNDLCFHSKSSMKLVHILLLLIVNNERYEYCPMRITHWKIRKIIGNKTFFNYANSGGVIRCIIDNFNICNIDSAFINLDGALIKQLNFSAKRWDFMFKLEDYFSILNRLNRTKNHRRILPNLQYGNICWIDYPSLM